MQQVIEHQTSENHEQFSGNKVINVPSFVPMKTSLPLLFRILACLISLPAYPQASNITCSNALAEKVMRGNYTPAEFPAPFLSVRADSLPAFLLGKISSDSMKAYTIRLAAFHNRNAGSDTTSSAKGIGAARRWIFNKFQHWSASSGNRLIPAYLSFNQAICSINLHRNVLAVLPGTDTSDRSLILIEGHMDSRCEGLCDTACLAQGVEDNASGTVLTMELVRVMAGMNLKRTIVFMITTAEEQGLYGAEAFADYAQAKGIQIRAVQNNDVIGGIICGNTASPPGCSGLNTIDSLQVRLFSSGGFNSKHKQYARFVKLEYKENIQAIAPVKMLVSVMSPEDRTGRGGDHIPFRQHGYTAIRFTSANEHGNANVSLSSYNDRQHSFRDTLGVDKDGNAVIDSFFVDFNYLARNAVINANAAAMAASGPVAPAISASLADTGKIAVSLTGQGPFRVGIRTVNNDWDSVYSIIQNADTILLPFANRYYVSAATVDSLGIESLFSSEITLNTTANENMLKNQLPELLPNRPNPFDEATLISVFAGNRKFWKKAALRISDMKGNVLQEISLELKEGLNEVLYEHGYNMQGILNCTLLLDGKPFQSRQMIFAN